jgi:hypothetical protein
MTGERVKNVPNRLNEKAAIASSTVQLLKMPRRSVNSQPKLPRTSGFQFAGSLKRSRDSSTLKRSSER